MLPLLHVAYSIFCQVAMPKFIATILTKVSISPLRSDDHHTPTTSTNISGNPSLSPSPPTDKRHHTLVTGASIPPFPSISSQPFSGLLDAVSAGRHTLRGVSTADPVLIRLALPLRCPSRVEEDLLTSGGITCVVTVETLHRTPMRWAM